MAAIMSALFAVVTLVLTGGYNCVNVETVAFGETVWTFMQENRVIVRSSLWAGDGVHVMCSQGDFVRVEAIANGEPLEIISGIWTGPLPWPRPTPEPEPTPEPTPTPTPTLPPPLRVWLMHFPIVW